MQAIPILFMAGGSILKGVSAYRTGKYNARVEENNAILARQKATHDEAQHRRELLRLQGRQRAIIGRSGTTMSGSNLDVLADTAREGELDALLIRHGGKVRSNSLLAEAEMEKRKGKFGLAAGLFGAASTVLTGQSKLFGGKPGTKVFKPTVGVGKNNTEWLV